MKLIAYTELEFYNFSRDDALSMQHSIHFYNNRYPTKKDNKFFIIRDWDFFYLSLI